MQSMRQSPASHAVLPSSPGWCVVPIAGPPQTALAVTRALEVARTRWERGALGLR